MRNPIFLASLLLLTAVSSRAQAQIKLPVYEGDARKLQKVRFEEAAAAADFQHGRLVRVKMEGDGDAVQGVLVRVDRKKGLVYVRTEPGSPPQAFDVKKIKKLEKGVIREVSYNGDVSAPEIHQLVIENGTRRTVSYSAPTLSTAEIERLNELAWAENEFARIEYLTSLEDRVLENDVAIQNEQRKARELANEFRRRELIGSFDRFVTGNGSLEPVMTPSSQGEPMPSIAGAPSSPFVRIGPAVFPHLPLDPAARVAARQKLLAAQSLGVFEGGRLIAVVADAPTK